MYAPKYLSHDRSVIQLETDGGNYIVAEPGTTPVLFAEAVSGVYGAVADYVPDEGDGPVIPDVVVSRLQAKAALFKAGLLQQVEDTIALLDPITQMAWAEAIEFKRSSPLLNAIAEYVTWPDGTNLTADDIDAIFVSAQTIEV